MVKFIKQGNPFADPIYPFQILHGGIYQSRADFCQQIQWWPLLHSSLFCCPSITAQALRAAMVAAELPLRGKLRAEATIFSTDPFFLEVFDHGTPANVVYCSGSLVFSASASLLAIEGYLCVICQQPSKCRRVESRRAQWQ